MHPVEELGRQVRRWMEEVANTGDTCKNHGQPSTCCLDRKVAFRDLGIVEQGLPEDLVPVEGGRRDETVGEQAMKASNIATGSAVRDPQILCPPSKGNRARAILQVAQRRRAIEVGSKEGKTYDRAL